jgi:tRNA 2-thiocytidine biosynthesis protein TtcA
MSRVIALEKKLMRLLGRVDRDFDILSPGDRVMVGLSGGKDSWAMLHLLRRINEKANLKATLIGVNLDQGHPGFPAHRIEEYLVEHGYQYKMLHQDTYRIVVDKVPEGKTYCSLCSRLRRGILYSAAKELGCNKIALGHHRDDLIETVMLNLLYSGQLKAMAPKLHADDGENIVIRPLAYCAEEDIAEYVELMGFPVLPCNLCGSQDNLQRQQVKNMLRELSDRNPNVKGSMMSAIGNIRVSHLLDRELMRLHGPPTGLDETVI